MAESHDPMVELRRQVLVHYPIGSEWYDCAQDIVGEVILHVETRGLLMRSRSDPSSLMAFDYGDLLRLPSRLITPRDGGYFYQYRADRETEEECYKEMLKERGLDGEGVWG
jgi:hypothetical protein